MSEEIVVISVGGSLVFPDNADINFLNSFKDFIMSRKERFAIIVGGGKTARRYQEAGSQIGKLNNEDLDWLGIYATYINAKLVQLMFKDVAHPEILIDEPKALLFKKKVLVSAGWEPGWSTDRDTIIIAEKLGAKKVINLSNIDYAYDKDPKKHPDAKPIEEATWEDFRKILPEKWEPGLNSPFDPVAAEIAQNLGIEVAIMNGKDMNNLKTYLDGKDFKGTAIR